MAKRKASGGSSIVLILFLLFFILLSIGLGVSTYLGFSQDDSKDKELKKVKTELKDAQDQMEWYKFQAQAYRTALGYAQNESLEKLANARDEFIAGKLPPASKKDEKEDVKTLLTSLDTKLGGWDKDQKRWKTTYEQLISDEQKKTDQAVKNSIKFQENLEKANARAVSLDDQLIAANKAYEAKLDTAKKEAEENLTKALANNATLALKVNELSDQMSNQAKAHEEDKALWAKALKVKEDANRVLREQVQRKTDLLAAANKERGTDVAANLRMDWKVVKIDSRAESVYINLGSADKVKPQLTFRVHGIGVDGKPVLKDKATIEVMTVLGDHLSQAKIIYDRLPREAPRHDPVHNPVVEGDIIINPSWNPNQKKHIAIAGLVDLSGSGRDETAQFIRMLENQDIVVDAYLDLKKDFTIKGPGITVQTDYLILGDSPRDVLGVASGPAKEITQKIKDEMLNMSKQAKENGVRVQGLRAFLDEIGYRVPGNPENKAPALDLKSDPGASTPKDPMKEEKPLPPPVPGQ